MPVHIDDLALYRAFVDNQIESLQCLKFDPDRVVWHYTSGAGLLGVIESGPLWATQVSCLNDSTEVRYGSKLFRDALVKLRQSMPPDPEVEQMLDQTTSALLEDPSTPSHVPSMYFVTCFSEHEDDLSQWRAYSGGENGYAVGFRARGLFGNPNSLVIRVNYDTEQHLAVAEQVAAATVKFFRDGIEKGRAPSPAEWMGEFLPVWTNYIGQHCCPEAEF